MRLKDLDYAAIDRVFAVNWSGTLYLTKTFLPILLARPEGHIVNVSSMGGFLPVPGQTVYGASKAAVKLFTEGLNSECPGTNVHVTVVFPGAVATNITTNSGVDIPATTANARPWPAAPPRRQGRPTILDGMEHNALPGHGRQRRQAHGSALSVQPAARGRLHRQPDEGPAQGLAPQDDASGSGA